MGIHGAVQLAIPLLKQLRVSCKTFCLSPSWRSPTATAQEMVTQKEKLSTSQNVA